ncbi:MAG: helix-turn-helix domain-containing protein [Phenylobacterium sp.]|jgi:transcriptional regulator GlxA family with amidase domain|nr:MAG: helix-turn-helix domain-containing protein [Phenylobacterium sp.]
MSDWMCPICGSDLAVLGLSLETEQPLGVALALAVSLVKLLERAGGPAQAAMPFPAREPIRRVRHWIHDNLGEDLSVAQLARRAGMSQRNFARAFVQETEMTPAEFVELRRIAVARRLLDTSALGLQQIAFECGFSSTQALRRAFLRRSGVTPSEYRRGRK